MKMLFLAVLLLSALSCLAAGEQRISDVVNMQKNIYSVLGQYEVPEIVSRFHPEFKRLDVDGTLAATLDSLYEMRLLDMQISIQHAKKMRSVLDALGHPFVENREFKHLLKRHFHPYK